jgi:hypothetical protein
MSEITLRSPKTVTMDDIMNELIAMEAAASKDQAREQSKTVPAISTTL